MESNENIHKAAYVGIIGKPNAGKSTLLNRLIGEDLAAITHKAQTTRHRIAGILNTDDFQIVFLDTPGILNPSYKLQETMMDVVEESITDSDVLLLIIDAGEKNPDPEVLAQLSKTKVPLIVALNKMDTLSQEKVAERIEFWQTELNPAHILPISALHKFNMDGIVQLILQYAPVHPPFFPKDEISDRNLRFFVSEMIRKQILLHYHKEIPYSVEVVIDEYKEEENIDRISAQIMVERDSQRVILIGKGGESLKRIGRNARLEMEKFIGKKVFLSLFVKVKGNWRNDDKMLKHFGYRKE